MWTRDAESTELMDVETLAPEELRGPLDDLRHINFLLGWTRLAVRTVAREVRARRLTALTLVDVASGSADIPQAIARWAARQGIPARIVATDFHPTTVALARAKVAGTPGMRVEQRNALDLGYPPASFDIALCTLALHHFAPDDAVRVLAQLGRAGRQVLVFDLVRSRAAYVGAILLTRLVTRSPITRHDGPISVRRAYTAEELRALAARAGLRDARVSVRFPFRLVLEASGLPPVSDVERRT